MAKITILKTNKGTKILGAIQCSNGAYWDAEGCYNIVIVWIQTL